MLRTMPVETFSALLLSFEVRPTKTLITVTTLGHPGPPTRRGSAQRTRVDRYYPSSSSYAGVAFFKDIRPRYLHPGRNQGIAQRSRGRSKLPTSMAPPMWTDCVLEHTPYRKVDGILFGVLKLNGCREVSIRVYNIGADLQSSAQWSDNTSTQTQQEGQKVQPGKTNRVLYRI
ncbi:hypothetical protein B0T14DRAFT_267881 [Immersiella caudata]|uniref:Uncharacterized protein n=1 Tax=Immersiella caudata TaxID=314043 RepID=A0AA39WL24_9PEZI|nr:hypothetical protein B0T14DRAFT_267881 [Immersiella caudata]